MGFWDNVCNFSENILDKKTKEADIEILKVKQEIKIIKEKCLNQSDIEKIIQENKNEIQKKFQLKNPDDFWNQKQ